MWISTAFWLPSDCGMPVTPMNALSLMSESGALTIPRTAARLDHVGGNLCGVNTC
jgi:hypothetical protein